MLRIIFIVLALLALSLVAMLFGISYLLTHEDKVDGYGNSKDGA